MKGTAFVLLCSILVTAPVAEAQPEADLWSATLTVAANGPGTILGCGSRIGLAACSSNLTDNVVEWGGRSYEIHWLGIGNGRLEVALGSHLSLAHWESSQRALTLFVDRKSYTWGHDTLNNGFQRQFWRNGPTWVAGQEVELKLVLIELVADGAKPPCGSTVSDMSVQPVVPVTLRQPSSEEIALDYRIVRATSPATRWLSFVPIVPGGRGEVPPDATFAELRNAYPDFLGFEYRSSAVPGVKSLQCTWRFKDDDDDDSPPPSSGGTGGGPAPPPDDDDPPPPSPGGTGGGPAPRPDDGDDEPSTCTLAAPFWSGPSGGFTVRPAPDRRSVRVTCGAMTREHAAEGGLVTRLVRGPCPGGLTITGAAPGGWYWQHGERNAAAAPLVCSESLGGSPAVVPDGVEAEARDTGTWFRHDTARLVGIVPHLAGNECSEYVSPYWQGDGGVVVRPAPGRRSVRVRVQCGATFSTVTARSPSGGAVAELIRRDYCTDDAGNPKQGSLTVNGAAPGGWYWIAGERNAAVAPLMCADLLDGPAAVVPGGVEATATDTGTWFEHDTARLVGVVPHLAPPE